MIRRCFWSFKKLIGVTSNIINLSWLLIAIWFSSVLLYLNNSFFMRPSNRMRQIDHSQSSKHYRTHSLTHTLTLSLFNTLFNTLFKHEHIARELGKGGGTRIRQALIVMSVYILPRRPKSLSLPEKKCVWLHMG